MKIRFMLWEEEFMGPITGNHLNDRSLLNKCEVYNYHTDTWSEIAPMNKTRCTCSAFIYMGFIYVIGGYTGEFQRSKKVLVY
jgi:hypothetical protein